MLKNRLLLLFSIALILLLIVPSAFGADNDTASLDSSSDNQMLASDIYFDSNATNDHGEGTADDPYKKLRDGRILDDSVIHLKNGEYEFNQLNSHTNISIIGQDTSETVIRGNGGTLLVNNRLVLENVTICNLNIFNQGNLIATNTVFANSSAIKNGNYGNSLGGAIYCVNEYHNAYLTNCTFINNYAGCGGAIYVNGGILEITDCAFINNTSLNYGGAIACESKYSKKVRLTIKRSRFVNDTSLKDAGGAIYVRYGTFAGEDLSVSKCEGTFGGAFSLLKSYVNLNNLSAFDNVARYDGGAIYQIYGNLTITNSGFSANRARNGGGLYVDDSYRLDIGNVSFINNSAELLAGAFYSLENDMFIVNNITYTNNTALEYDDLFRLENMSIIFSSGNYTLYNHVSDDSSLPVYYSSVDEGYVTPVKNQQNGGNCWAFATLATLESAILKASGDSIILSEENMKNLASLYSNFGWSMETNDGGYDDMGFGYLTSWLGPVLDSDDEYTYFTALSPVLNSILHVQNILFLKRTSYYDLDEVKKAIRDYGAVYTPIYMYAHYDSTTKKYVQCYRGSNPCDHAVALVGWDDNFKISGYTGAWIAKNSWGSDWGSDGYFYISYFDNSCLRLGDFDGGLAFIFNDTMKYDKNYQYDISKTDFFFNTTKSVWYKNVFTSTDNEFLAAVSTYFEKDTRWELTISINDSQVFAKSGNSHAGYCTLDLGRMIPLNAGDVFEIMFKITVDGDAGVPISESISLNNRFYRENISYISYDGRNWRDMFNISWEYPDHTYDSQVACIKAFTILNPINASVTLTYENRTQDRITIAANVLNKWGYPVSHGNLSFIIGDEIYNLTIIDGVAKKQIELKSANITVEFNEVGYSPSVAHAELKNPPVNTFMTLNITGDHNPVNITATVVDENNGPVKYGNVIFDIGGRMYAADVVNGIAKLENIEIYPLKSVIHAQYEDMFYYNSSYANMSVELSLINTTIYLDIETNEFNNPVGVVAHVFDANGNPVTCGKVVFDMAGELFEVDAVNGTAGINHTFAQTGNNTISATFIKNNIYNSSLNSTTLNVSPMKVNLSFDIVIDQCNVYISVAIKNSIRDFRISIRVNGTDYSYESTKSPTKDDTSWRFVMYELKNLKMGSYDYVIKLISAVYESDDLEGTFNITYQSTQIIASDASIYYNGAYSVTLKDESGNPIANRDVYLKVNGQTIKKRTNGQGIAVFNIATSVGTYEAKVSFIGDDEYIESSKTVSITIKTTIEFKSGTYTFNAKYVATLRDSKGNLLKNVQASIVLDGVGYKIISDENGQVSLNIKLNPGTYTVKITNPGTGEVKSQKITVVKRITKNKDLTMYYGAGKSYKVKVVDDNGKAVKGLKVTFRINGKKHYVYTDKSGYASLKITKNPGKYTVTAEYKGFKVSNKINVKSTIVTKNIKVKKGKAIKFKAKLLNSKGKVLKYKIIKFKFKGKTYKVKTNKKGIAVLKITKKYKRGKYTISSKYGSLKIKNRIRIV